MRARLRAVAITCLLAGGGFSYAQNAAARSDAGSRDTPATFKAGVNLVTVPVVVRDRAGDAVGTLTQDDFQLFDKGKPQVITKFSVEKTLHTADTEVSSTHGGNAAGLGAAMPSRFVAYLFDDVHLEFGDWVRVRNAAVKHLQELAPTDRAAIYTTSGRTQIDFTDDAVKLRETLSRIVPKTDHTPETECPYVSFYMGDLIRNHNDRVALGAAISEAYRCAHLDPKNPADRMMAEYMAKTAAFQAVGIGEYQAKLALSVLKAVINRLSATPGQRSIVLASPGFFISGMHRQDETDVMDRAIRAKVLINSLNGRGLWAPSLSSILYEAQSNSADSYVLGDLAAGTGGALFQNNNDLALGFRRLAAPPEFVYLLGFSPQDLKLDGSFHTLKVSLRDSKRLTWQVRRGYYAPRQALDPAEKSEEEIRSAVFSREEMLDIPLNIETHFSKPAEAKARLDVLAKLDVRHLPYRRVDDRNVDTLTMVSTVFDRDGNVAGTMEKRVEMSLRDETLASQLNEGLTLKSNFDLAPGNYGIRVVVRDEEGSLMAARNGVVEIP